MANSGVATAVAEGADIAKHYTSMSLTRFLDEERRAANPGTKSASTLRVVNEPLFVGTSVRTTPRPVASTVVTRWQYGHGDLEPLETG